MVPALGLILLAVLLGPVMIKPVERNIEVFFLIVGALAAAVSGQWSWPLVHAAVTEPIALTIAVLVFGAVACLMRPAFDRWIQRLLGVMSAHWSSLILIFVLVLLSR